MSLCSLVYFVKNAQRPCAVLTKEKSQIPTFSSSAPLTCEFAAFAPAPPSITEASACLSEPFFVVVPVVNTVSVLVKK